jgi:ribosome biogenesis GTPase
MEVTAQLRDLGWNAFFESHFEELHETGLTPARVVEEFKGHYRVRSEQAEYLAETAGKIQYQAASREDFPAVGDWVAIIARPEEGRARIECVLSRRTKLARKVAGRELTEQIVATNLDTVFVVSALNREFNLRRIERYLTIVWDSGARPVVLLNKADLCPHAPARAAEVESVALGNSGAPAERAGEDWPRSAAEVCAAGNHGCVCGLVRGRQVHHHQWARGWGTAGASGARTG